MEATHSVADLGCNMEVTSSTNARARPSSFGSRKEFVQDSDDEADGCLLTLCFTTCLWVAALDATSDPLVHHMHA